MIENYWPLIQQQIVTGAQLLVAVCGAIVLRHLWALAREQAARIADDRLREFVGELVDAAEQQFRAVDGCNKPGAEKRDYVMEHLLATGVKVEKADALLEAAVYRAGFYKPLTDFGAGGIPTVTKVEGGEPV